MTKKEPFTDLGGPQLSFSATPWTTVLKAAGNETEARAAWEKLATLYWKPVYAFLRLRWGKSNDDAKVLTQDFFLHLMKGERLRRVDPEMGKFRTFLLSILENVVKNEARDRGRIKRGGLNAVIPLINDDAIEVDKRLGGGVKRTPEDVFELEWARAVLGAAHDILRTKYSAEGKEPYLRVYDLWANSDPQFTYQDIAKELGLSENQVRNYLFSVKKELQEIIRSLVAQTCTSNEEVEQELKWLLQKR